MGIVTARLDNWFRRQVTKEEFIIWGIVTAGRDNRFMDGEFIHTSGIRNRSVEEGDIVNTRNSTYLLGKQIEVRA